MMVPLQIASALRERGYDAEVWFLYKYRSTYENAPGVRLIYPHSAGGLLDYARIFWGLFWAMRAFRPDAVHGVVSLGNVFGLLSATLIGCPSRVASQHNPANTQGHVMRWLDMMLGTIGVYTANIAVSHAVEKSYANYPSSYRCRLRVIQNAVPDRPARRTKLEARRYFGLPEQARILGNLGRLSYQKNQDFLFAVLGRLEGVHLAIAGDGELRDEYAEQVCQSGLEDRIHLLGSIPVVDVPDFLQAIDVFVFPSRYEGLPIALLEAMKAGLPIVASDIGPAREVISPEGREPAGLLLGIERAETWIGALREVLHDPERIAKLAEAARRRAEDFRMDQMVDSYEACLLGTQERS